MNHGQLSNEKRFSYACRFVCDLQPDRLWSERASLFPTGGQTAPPPTKPVNPGIQSATPDRNDRGDTGGPSQVNY